MRPILLFTAGGLALLAAPPVLAQPTDVGPVTVTRATTLPADAVGATVVTEQDILLRQAASPREVLNTIPGLSVERTGAFGGLLTVRQRGASTDKTLVLLNGVPLNDPSQPSGSTDVNLIDMADVTRIEVLSGPQGSLWGSSAIGGVIAFTARPLDGWRAALEGGAFGYARGAASIGVVTDRFQAGLSAAGWRADGISQADERDGNPEADGAWSYTVGGQGRFAVTPNLGVFGQLRYLQTRADTDGYPPPNFTFADTAEWAENRTWFGQAGLDANTLGFGHRLTYGYYDVDRANLGGDFPSSYTATRQVVRYTASRGAPEDRLGVQAGVEYNEDQASLSDGAKLSIDNGAAFVVLRTRPLDRLSLTGSVRYDNPSNYEDAFTGRVAGVFDLGAGFSLTGAWGQGFKTPTISQLACDFCFPGGPALDLRPEHATGYEAGLRYAGARASAQVTLYQLSVRDQIDFSAAFPFRYANLEATRTRGLEARAEYAVTDLWRLRWGYAYTDAEDRATGAQLLRVPLHSGSISLAYLGPRLSGELVVRAEGDQADAGGRRDGFVVVNLYGQYRLNPTVQLFGRLENVTDTDYQEVLGYGEPGIAAFVGMRLSGG